MFKCTVLRFGVWMSGGFGDVRHATSCIMHHGGQVARESHDSRVLQHVLHCGVCDRAFFALVHFEPLATCTRHEQFPDEICFILNSTFDGPSPIPPKTKNRFIEKERRLMCSS